ncbi:MAG: glycosyltransferase family 1 protein [Acidobacteria bacterium]|nr:glycosyltransferase family 1 protein [Acidobacteriota bacterium]MBV9188161.1 glycosyltransferase family 1 protein [Acidobacteriota bacterium]
MSAPIVFLCAEDELDKERRGYARAFGRIAPVIFVPPSENWQVRADGSPQLLLNPDGRPWLPAGIERSAAPTAIFHIDTYVALERRVRWSALYDYTFVFHPGFEAAFEAAGIEGVRLLPHAAERDLFDGAGTERDFDVGWVGRKSRSIYGTRDHVLAALTERFVMNDASRFYTPEEMAEIYRRSKIVVNISRDDHPSDANMRCFEAMAAGALLMTGIPSELTLLGFEENVHFAGYRNAEEIPDLVASWLARDAARTAIAQRARDLVLREHTYDTRVATILDAVRSGAQAPARAWPRDKVAARRFEYYVEAADVARSVREFREITAASPLSAARNAVRFARLGAKVIKRKLR